MWCSTSKNARRERLGGVVIGNRHRGLHDDRTRIGFRNDEMYGRAGNLHAGADRLPVRIESGKRRQQGRVDVDHPALPARHEGRGEQPHEAARQTSSILCWSRMVCSAASKVARSLPNGLWSSTAVATPALRAVVEARPHPGGWTSPARSRPGSPGSAPPRSAPPCSSRGPRSGSRRACGHCQDRACRHRRRAAPRLRRDDLAEPRDCLAFAREHRRTASALSGCHHHDHADAAVEGAQHLGLGDAAGRGEPA